MTCSRRESAGRSDLNGINILDLFTLILPLVNSTALVFYGTVRISQKILCFHSLFYQFEKLKE